MYCGHNWDRWWHPSGKRFAGQATDMRGVNATWVTSNMLALSRPSSRIIREYGLVDEFVKHGVQHIFNLTEYGEHPHCGDQLVPGGGFSYRPEEFTEKGVGYSNPAWEDMGCPSFELMEVVVRQAREILSKGGKVAVHCHAGMGRTGLVIASIMIAEGKSPEDALQTLRAKRPHSVQSVPQEEFLVRFAEYLEARGLKGKL